MSVNEEEYGYVSRDQTVLERANERIEKCDDEEQDDRRASSTGSYTGEQFRSDGQQETQPNSSKKRTSMSSSSNETTAQQATSSSTKQETKTDITDVTLPQAFQVKYLGRRDARGLWGIKHTRKPVDAMVASAKTAAISGIHLPVIKLTVAQNGVSLTEIARHKDRTSSVIHAIDTISYGVQDLVYTRVFSMIVVRETTEMKGQHPFECHAFVCDSRAQARKLTYALAAAFHEYSRSIKASQGSLQGVGKRAKKFAIDLRTPEQIEKDLQTPQEADSEA